MSYTRIAIVWRADGSVSWRRFTRRNIDDAQDAAVEWVGPMMRDKDDRIEIIDEHLFPIVWPEIKARLIH